MVRQIWQSVGVLGLGLAVLGPVYAQPQSTCTFEVRTRSKVGYRGSARYFIKGDWVREEKRSGGGLELVMVSNDTGLFIRNAHSNYWFKYPGGSRNHLKERLLGGPVGDVQAFLKKLNAKTIRHEKLKNEMCTVWAYQYPRIRDSFRLWISDKTGKPLQLERDHLVPLPDGTSKRDTLVVDYRSYVCNSPVDDKLFKIGADEKIHDVGPGLRELGQALRKPGGVDKMLAQPSPNTPAPEKK